MEPAEGKLGILLVGLGAVATTYVAGVENMRQGRAKPVGSLAEIGTIRLGKRTDARSPLIRDFVPLAALAMRWRVGRGRRIERPGRLAPET